MTSEIDTENDEVIRHQSRTIATALLQSNPGVV